MADLRDELLEMTPSQLRDTLHLRGRDKKYVSAVVGVFQAFKLRGNRAERLDQPGLMQVQFSPVKIGDDEMIKVTPTFPTPPDPATTDPDKVPVKQQFSASVAGAQVAGAEYDIAVTAPDSFVVDYDTEVTLSLTYSDADGLVSQPQVQTFRTPAKAVPVVNLPPDAPGAFGEVKLEEVA